VSNTKPPRDRFDEVPSSPGRVGAHRAENPRTRGWVTLLWALAATVLIVAIGIFATLLASGRIQLFPEPTPEPAPVETVDPIVDTAFTVLVLNGTSEQDLATRVGDKIQAAGWAPELVLTGAAGSRDVETTTVYYSAIGDQAAALGLADVIGGAEVVQNDFYQPSGDPDALQLTVVLGADYLGPVPSGTPSAKP